MWSAELYERYACPTVQSGGSEGVSVQLMSVSERGPRAPVTAVAGLGKKRCTRTGSSVGDCVGEADGRALRGDCVGDLVGDRVIATQAHMTLSIELQVAVVAVAHDEPVVLVAESVVVVDESASVNCPHDDAYSDVPLVSAADHA